MEWKRWDIKANQDTTQIYSEIVNEWEKYLQGLRDVSPLVLELVVNQGLVLELVANQGSFFELVVNQGLY